VSNVLATLGNPLTGLFQEQEITQIVGVNV